jgi:hypothetical protein
MECRVRGQPKSQRPQLRFYSKPEWIPGLEAGGSYLNGDIAASGLPKVFQSVSSAYAVYITGKWEFLNEMVLMHHQISGGGRSYNSPMGDKQLAYHMNKYSPYFRFQETNVPNNDPVGNFVGRYEGPSFGLRYDIFDYAAVKVQDNRAYPRDAAPQNGIEMQFAFAF